MRRWLNRRVRHTRWGTTHKVTGIDGDRVVLDHRWEVSICWLKMMDPR